MLHYTTYNLQPLDYSQYVIPTQPITFKQITIQSIRYTYTTYNLLPLRLQSVHYTYTTYFQALKLQVLYYTYTPRNLQLPNNN